MANKAFAREVQVRKERRECGARTERFHASTVEGGTDGRASFPPTPPQTPPPRLAFSQKVLRFQIFLVLVIESIDDWMGYWQEVTETRHVPAPSLCLNHPYQPTPIVGGLGPSREVTFSQTRCRHLAVPKLGGENVFHWWPRTTRSWQGYHLATGCSTPRAWESKRGANLLCFV